MNNHNEPMSNDQDLVENSSHFARAIKIYINHWSRNPTATVQTAESPQPKSPPSKLSIPSKEKTDPKDTRKAGTGAKSLLDNQRQKTKSRRFSTSPGTRSSTRSADGNAPSVSHDKRHNEAVRKKRLIINRLIVGLSAGHALISILICVGAYVARRNLGADLGAGDRGDDVFSFLNRTGKIYNESMKLMELCYKNISIGESYEALISCTYLSRSLHYNCHNVSCMRADHSFAPDLGRFVDHHSTGVLLRPRVGDQCADEFNTRCRDPNNKSIFFCLDHLGRLLAHTSEVIPEVNISWPMWVDGCGTPDLCTIYSRDPFIRTLIMAGRSNFRLLYSCIETQDTCDKDYRDAVVRVRFLHCTTRYKLGEKYCSGSPIRFEICHKCPFMYYKPSIISSYWDFNMCGPINYDYSIGCRVHCADGSVKIKPNGRLCQPSFARFDYLYNVSPVRPMSNVEGGPSYYMCYRGECVEVYEDAGDIPSSHCYESSHKKHQFVYLPKKVSQMTFRAGPGSPGKPLPAPPSGPASPGGPFGPLGPGLPAGPGMPGGQGGHPLPPPVDVSSPFLPSGPALPGAPSAPSFPAAPGGPGGPTAPCWQVQPAKGMIQYG
uniref:Uncharacterized protein n=1 Tax=Romanomermis culicivorax TaxID=13658 RepID=A0A915ICR4_ROMCU